MLTRQTDGAQLEWMRELGAVSVATKSEDLKGLVEALRAHLTAASSRT